MNISYTFNLDHLFTETNHSGLVFQIYIGISRYKCHKKAGLHPLSKDWKHHRVGIPPPSLLRVNVIDKYYLWDFILSPSCLILF